MANDEPFQPEFGPNGAVMNAPLMTPEMRAKYDRIGKMPTRGELLALAPSLLFLAVVFLVVGWMFYFGRGLMRESPWWAGAIFGAVAVLAVGVVWRTARDCLSRWEIMGGEARVLTAPLWMRLPLFVTDFVGKAAYAGAFVAIVADPRMEVGSAMLAMYLLAFVMWSLHAFLKWLAERRGWM